MNLEALLVAVLSYDVHGLAAILVDNSVVRIPEISERLNRYDVALAQESWAYGVARIRITGAGTSDP